MNFLCCCCINKLLLHYLEAKFHLIPYKIYLQHDIKIKFRVFSQKLRLSLFPGDPGKYKILPSLVHYNHYKTTVKCTIMFLMDFIKIFIVVEIGRHAVLILLCTKDKTSLFLFVLLAHCTMGKKVGPDQH